MSFSSKRKHTHNDFVWNIDDDESVMVSSRTKRLRVQVTEPETSPEPPYRSPVLAIDDENLSEVPTGISSVTLGRDSSPRFESSYEQTPGPEQQADMDEFSHYQHLVTHLRNEVSDLKDELVRKTARITELEGRLDVTSNKLTEADITIDNLTTAIAKDAEISFYSRPENASTTPTRLIRKQWNLLQDQIQMVVATHLISNGQRVKEHGWNSLTHLTAFPKDVVTQSDARSALFEAVIWHHLQEKIFSRSSISWAGGRESDVTEEVHRYDLELEREKNIDKLAELQRQRSELINEIIATAGPMGSLEVRNLAGAILVFFGHLGIQTDVQPFMDALKQVVTNAVALDIVLRRSKGEFSVEMLSAAKRKLQWKIKETKVVMEDLDPTTSPTKIVGHLNENVKDVVLVVSPTLKQRGSIDCYPAQYRDWEAVVRSAVVIEWPTDENEEEAVISHPMM